MGFFTSLRTRIQWKWEFGINKSDKTMYRIEYTCKPISNSAFNLMAKKQLAQTYGDVKIEEVAVGKTFELSPEVIKHNEQMLLFSLPRVRPSNEKLLSRGVMKVKYAKQKEGWVIFIAIEGIRRLF